MKRPVLVIMAAGMGSRYGGLKQIDPIDREGHIIIDFSIYDARRAGFEKVVFIIKKDNEEEFKELSDIPYFYLDEFELDINRYYESAGLTLLNENVKEVFPDVEFQFRKEAA